MHKQTIKIRPLPYQRNANTYASRLTDLPGLAVLVSRAGDTECISPTGRYDIVTALPRTDAPHL